MGQKKSYGFSKKRKEKFNAYMNLKKIVQVMDDLPVWIIKLPKPLPRSVIFRVRAKTAV